MGKRIKSNNDAVAKGDADDMFSQAGVAAE